MQTDYRKEHFLSLLRKSISGCHEFMGWRDSFGYGRFKYKSSGKWVQRAAHRHAVQIATGRELGPDEVCRHACDNPSCCNPDHLSIGTQMDNVADRVRRKRSATGQWNGQSKLTDCDVRVIRNSTMTNKELAARFGVVNSTISRVRRGLQHQPKEGGHG